jgi:NAD(P)-dependent dehydrogenase (short-subunit alcohol dehydrogenase family)
MRSLIVTGATGGLGTEVVRHLSSTYECIALTRSMADLGDPASVRQAIRAIAEKHGAPYGLVHLAGGFTPGSLLDTTDEIWSQMLAMNVTGAFHAIRETLQVMDRASAGRIVAISAAATLAKGPGIAAYTVAKSALNALIEVVAKELKDTPITVNALLPVVLDSLATRQRAAETIAFLLSDSASHVTGALIPLSAQ